MSGIIGSKFNIRGSGLVGSLGTDGQHMLSAGAGKTNVFETVAAAAGGAWTLIESQTISDDATIDFTTLSADYFDIMIIGSNVVASNDDIELWFRQSHGSGFLTSSTYQWGSQGVNVDGAEKRHNSAGDVKITLCKGPNAGNASGENIEFQLLISNVHATTNQKMIYWQTSYAGIVSTDCSGLRGVGRNTTITAVDGLRIMAGSGNLDTGNITAYGRKLT